jgi:flavodoxin
VSETNQAPTVANAIADQTHAEGATVNLNLATVFADGDSDPLTLSLSAGSLPPGLTFNAGAKTITGTLTFASAGSYPGITITANDGNGGTANDTFLWTVTGTNQAPTVANAIADQTHAEGATVNLNLATVFADGDSDPLTLSLSAGSLPPGLTFNAAAKTITGTLTFASAGSYPGITITANDGNGGTANDTFVWTVSNTNRAPTVANAIANQSSAEGAVINLDLSAVFADADGNPLSLSLTSGTLPAGLALNGTSITGTLSFASAGSYLGLVITASDGLGGTVTDSFDWTVANTNRAPTFTAEPYAFLATEGASAGTAVGTLQATDLDANTTLQYAITGGNTGGAFAVNPATGAITVATPAAVIAGTFTLTVTVGDGTDSDTSTVTITVQSGAVLPDAIFRNGFEN